MKIIELRQLNSRALEPLFQEEVGLWLEELFWDYRPSVQLIKKFMDARSLAGYAALADGAPAGYGFFITEGTKGLIGGLYVSQRFAEQPAAHDLLAQMLATLRATPKLVRIEAQLMPFGTDLDRTLAAHGFRLFTRQFMLLPLRDAPESAAPIPAGLRLDPWDDRYFEPCARLIHAAYENHVDGEINDQYRSFAGAMKFLKNIIVLPGCGQFLPEASFLVRPQASERLVAAVLTSEVSSGVGHTTQICVAPGYQRQGLGLRLMEASIRALRSRRFHALSLTVTAQNDRAVRLYERLGFRTIKSFAAAVWEA